jgi:AcrR family transcriptional regulator
VTQAPADAPEAAPRTGTRRRGEALRRSIFDATLELLRTVGYARLTMEGVATAAGTGKAALYRRWRDREDLVTDALRNALPDPHDILLTGDTRDDIVALLGCVRDTADLSMDAAYQVVKREATMDSGLGTIVQVRVLDPCRALVTGVLRRGIESGELRAEAAGRHVADVGPAMLIHYTVTLGPPVPDTYIAAVVDEVIMPLVRRC